MSEIREAALELKRHTRASATHEAYDSDWGIFARWCEAAGRAALPASAETLALYVASRLQDGSRASTVTRNIAAIVHRHRCGVDPLGAAWPVPDRADARLIILGARRQRGEQPARKAALTPDQLRKIAAKLMRLGGAAAFRDRAILTLGFGSALRRSNLVRLDLSDVVFRPKGLVVTVGKSKRDQEGRGQVIGVFRGAHPETCPVRALRDWLAYRGRRPGPLFTRVRAGDGLTVDRLGADAVAAIVKAAAGSIGLDPAVYGGHSLRAGFVTASRLAGTGDLRVMETTGHRSLEMLRVYSRNLDPFAGANPLGAAL